ncbi:MAG: YtxH domain-containing protein [Rikenellaceae bacterium]
MKNTGLLFSALGGAILGSAITCLIHSKKGKELRAQAHERIIKELHHLHAHLSNGMCKCSESGECSCSMDMPGENQGNE